MPMNKIIGFGGSPRAGGNTDILLNQFLQGARKEGVQTEKIFLRDYHIQPCIGCEQCSKGKTCTKFQDGMQLLYPKIEEARGIVLGSPTYNYNVTPWVKAFIDRLYPYYNFTDDRPRRYSSHLGGKGRKGIVFAVCEQVDISDMGCTLEAMRRPLEALGYEIIHEFRAMAFFERGRVAQDKELLERAFQQGAELARKLKYEPA